MSAPQPLVIATPEEALATGFVTDPAWFEPKVVTDAATGKTTTILPSPTYTVAEAAKFFFAQGADWLRWRIKKSADNPEEGFFVLDGKPLEDHRTDSNFRYYTLADIEWMAHALAQNGGITAAKLAQITNLIRTTCKMYGYVA